MSIFRGAKLDPGLCEPEEVKMEEEVLVKSEAEDEAAYHCEQLQGKELGLKKKSFTHMVGSGRGQTIIQGDIGGAGRREKLP